MYFNRSICPKELILSIQCPTIGGKLGGTIICLLANILSAKGTIILNVIPSKIVDTNIQMVAITINPLQGRTNLRSLR
ncbi:MAG: hypothetical protein NC817_01235 [Candidatus Omnitrophica bacterium]|nr:hypothetical protein [Candidatus Omnitrophota bacterium]